MLHSISTNAITHSRAWANGVVGCFLLGGGVVLLWDWVSQWVTRWLKDAVAQPAESVPRIGVACPRFRHICTSSIMRRACWWLLDFCCRSMFLPRRSHTQKASSPDSEQDAAYEPWLFLSFPSWQLEGHSGTLFFFRKFPSEACNILQYLATNAEVQCQDVPRTALHPVWNLCFSRCHGEAPGDRPCHHSSDSSKMFRRGLSREAKTKKPVHLPMCDVVAWRLESLCPTPCLNTHCPKSSPTGPQAHRHSSSTLQEVGIQVESEVPFPDVVRVVLWEKKQTHVHTCDIT